MRIHWGATGAGEQSLAVMATKGEQPNGHFVLRRYLHAKRYLLDKVPPVRHFYWAALGMPHLAVTF